MHLSYAGNKQKHRRTASGTETVLLLLFQNNYNFIAIIPTIATMPTILFRVPELYIIVQVWSILLVCIAICYNTIAICYTTIAICYSLSNYAPSAQLLHAGFISPNTLSLKYRQQRQRRQSGIAIFVCIVGIFAIQPLKYFSFTFVLPYLYHILMSAKQDTLCKTV